MVRSDLHHHDCGIDGWPWRYDGSGEPPFHLRKVSSRCTLGSHIFTKKSRSIPKMGGVVMRVFRTLRALTMISVVALIGLSSGVGDAATIGPN